MRLRYAPSPTGYLHIGNARTALFNYLYTKHYDGELIIRIEDTDIERNITDGVDSQLSNLKWLGIEWDESVDLGGPHQPYNQLKRHEEGIYKKYYDILLESKKAYKCFCTSEELEVEAQRQKENGQIPKYNQKCRHLSDEQIKEYEDKNAEYTIRFKVEENEVYEWEDVVKGNVSFNSKDVSGDFNIVKRDGIPTYNFAVVIDDHEMNITHVVRGEDHISNTPKQMMIYKALGIQYPTFAHMTLIVNQEGKKLSKRDTTIVQFIEDYKNLGYLPEAMFNFISLLGWSPVGEKEIFSKEELIKQFDEKRLSTSSAKFDVNKLKFINNQYMKKLDDETYLKFVKEYFEIKNNYDNVTLDKILLLYKDQISYGKEINEVSNVFFIKDIVLDEEAMEIAKNSVEVIKEYKSVLENETNIDIEKIGEIIKTVGANTEVKGKDLFMPIRVATTGQIHGPDIKSTIEIIGKDQIINNINNILLHI